MVSYRYDRRIGWCHSDPDHIFIRPLAVQDDWPALHDPHCVSCGGYGSCGVVHILATVRAYQDGVQRTRHFAVGWRDLDNGVLYLANAASEEEKE